MSIYKFALEFERENRNYYEKCAQDTDDNNLKSIFNYLAEEEKKHEEIVKALDEGDIKELSSDILPRAKQVFENMANKISVAGELPPREDLNVYRTALSMEQNSYKFYKAKAEESKDKEVEQLLLKLAKEEKRHEIIMGNILEHLERPEQWVESAEFNHIEKY